MSGFIDYINHHTDAGDLDWWYNDKLIEERGYASHVLVDHALDFIRKSKDSPFFLYLSFPEPHFPFMTPDDPAYFQPGLTYPDAGDPARSRLGPHDGSDGLQSVFYRMVQEMDGGIGKVVELLETLGLSDNTFIFFTSDNGGYVYYRQLNPETQRFDKATDLNYGKISNNGPYRGQKGELYEGGHRVPAIAWWPGRIPPGTVTDEAAMTFDLYPTFLEIAGIAQPADKVQQPLDGISLYLLLTRLRPLPERSLFWLFRGEGAVRRGKWKFLSHKERPEELYHLGTDPRESSNVVADHADIADQLRGELKTFQKLIKQASNQPER
jgi:arylsulfatase A-like enzyme